MAGAELRLDDHSLICLRSTAVVDGVTRSRIVPLLPEGSVVSTPRHHTGVVITEYGAADLSGLTVRERAAALVGIAHPDFRSGLAEVAATLGDGADPDGGRRVRPASLTLATFNVHMGVDGWGRPYDVVSGCAGPRRRPAGAAGVLGAPTVAPRARRPGWPISWATTWWPRWGWPTGASSPRTRPPPPAGAPCLTQVRTALRLDVERFRSRAGSADRPFVRGWWGWPCWPGSRSGTSRSSRSAGCAGTRPAGRSSAPWSDWSGGDLAVYGTHMSHITQGSHAQYRRLATAAPRRPRGGPGRGHEPVGPAGQLVLPGWRRAIIGRTWPAHRPHSQLDHVLVTPAVSVVDARVGRTSGSDHRPRGGHPGRGLTADRPSCPHPVTAARRSSVGAMTDTLDDFERTTFTAEGATRAIYRTGSRAGGHRDQRDARDHPAGGRASGDGGRRRLHRGHAPRVRRRRRDGRRPATPSGRSPRPASPRSSPCSPSGGPVPIIGWLRALARGRAPAVRRAGGGRGRHVLHRGVRPGHDGRRRGGGPGAQPTVAPLPRPGPAAPDVGLSDGRPGTGPGAGAPPAPACSGSASPATRPARRIASTISARCSGTHSSASSSTRRRATPTGTRRWPTRC